MSFVPNNASAEQLSLFDSFNTLTDREKRFLNKSWAKYFSENIFPKIDETPYAVLYSKNDSRPNTPVNVQIGALLIKEFTNLSDDEILTALMFDIRFQYALHTTSFKEQPMNDRTLGRFRERCATYEKETGIDLLQATIKSLSKEMAEMMHLDFSLKRMDSLMVASNIKRMSRMELLYTCVANLANEILKKEGTLPEDLVHYTEKDDRNRVIYHNRSDETAEKINTILADAKTIKELCGVNYDESSNYQLLLRVIKEQAVEEDGALRLRTKEDGGMDSEILQNPADPEATYRKKSGKQNRGYVANVIEVTGENGSIITDYQYEQNIYSDHQFLKDTVKAMGKQTEPTTIVADGAYSSEETRKLADENNIHLETTNLTGRKSDDFTAYFEFNEGGTRVTKCPGGYEPKSCSCNRNGQCTASFHRVQCESCPLFKQCNPKVNKRTCRKTVSLKAKERVEQQWYRSSEEFKAIAAFRNGVETIPSILRRKYHIDTMPVRGRVRTKFFFGCKIGALNFKKFCKYMQGFDSCTQNAVIA